MAHDEVSLTATDWGGEVGAVPGCLANHVVAALLADVTRQCGPHT